MLSENTVYIRISAQLNAVYGPFTVLNVDTHTDGGE